MNFTADIATKPGEPVTMRFRGTSPKVSTLEVRITAEGVGLAGTTGELDSDEIKQLCVVLRSAAKILVGFRAGLPAPMVAGVAVRNKPQPIDGDVTPA